MYVKSHGKDEEPRFVVLFTPCKEASEAVILLQYPKSSLDLNGAVHAQENSFGGREPFLGFFLLTAHGFGELYLSVLVLSLEALFPYMINVGDDWYRVCAKASLKADKRDKDAMLALAELTCRANCWLVGGFIWEAWI